MREPRRASDWDSDVIAALDGQASRELRRTIPLETRRRFGAFFTGTELGSRLIAHGGEFNQESVFYDPTCGMGDLLLAAAKKLPLGETLLDTLEQWGRRLTGTDLHREFVDGAKARLVLLARQRHASSLDRTAYMALPRYGHFPHIRVSDASNLHVPFERATHLLLNPPFGAIEVAPGCGWASGRVTAAASFVIMALERAKPDTEVLAVLPDVLRSGAFSRNWRSRVGELAKVRLVEPYGLFDETVDVDVFLLRAVRDDSKGRDPAAPWVTSPTDAGSTVADYFDVHVGRVVPHRDRKAGPRHPYIHPRCVPMWVVMRDFPETRKHEGPFYERPFVAIRRTSRPGHRYRAVATIIAGKGHVAVENHLIVCKPKDGKFSTCRELMARLKTETVNDFLNARIRCRHLTVGVVESIPFGLGRGGQ